MHYKCYTINKKRNIKKYIDTKSHFYNIAIYRVNGNTIAGCSAARLARLIWDQEVGGSNPLTPTSDECFGRLAQLGERLPYKQVVGGSSPSTPTI